MEALLDFAKVAPYLTDPLVLAGFALLLFFGVHRTLIRSGTIPPLSARSGSRIVQALLRYGFVIALVVIVLGFGLEFFERQNNAAMVKKEVQELIDRSDKVLGHVEAGPAAEPFNTSVLLEKDRTKLEAIKRDAEKVLERAGKGAEPEDYYQLGTVFLKLGFFENAIAAFLAVTDAKPEMGKAYLSLGVAYQLQANVMIRHENFGLAEEALDKAERSVKTAFQYDATDPMVNVQLGYVHKDLALRYGGTGRRDKEQEYLENAISQFKRALGADENNASAHNGLGSIYLIKGDYDKAIKACKKAIELEPEYLFAVHDLALAYYGKAQTSTAQRDRSEAFLGFLKAYETVIRLDRQDSSAGRLPTKARQNLDAIANSMLQEVRTVTSQPTGSLHDAARKGDLEQIKRLVAGGAHLDAKDKESNTPLHLAAQNGHKAAVELLIANGAGVDLKGEGNYTPLSWATRNGHKSIVELLIDRGANVNAKDIFGVTPLHWAAYNDLPTLVGLLLAKGANVNALDVRGNTPLRLAAQQGHGDMVTLLKSHGGEE